jgi:hypothetical protein
MGWTIQSTDSWTPSACYRDSFDNSLALAPNRLTRMPRLCKAAVALLLRLSSVCS